MNQRRLYPVHKPRSGEHPIPSTRLLFPFSYAGDGYSYHFAEAGVGLNRKMFQASKINEVTINVVFSRK